MRRINQMFLASLVLLLVRSSPTKASSGDANAEGSEGEERIPELRCGRDCSCSFRNKEYQNPFVTETYKEYEVVCDSTTMKSVTMTEAIFEEMNDDKVNHIYVRVEDTVQVTVTQGMLERWLNYSASAMDFSKVGRVLLPNVENLKRSSLPSISTPFTGIGLFDCGLDFFPSGLFNDKPNVGLHFLRSSVGHMSLSEVFKNVSQVKYLKIHDSNIGVLEAGMNRENFLQINMFSEVEVINSVLGTMKPGAVQIHSSESSYVYFTNVTIARSLTESIMIVGEIQLVMRDSRVAEMQQNAMVALSESFVIIMNSALILQPLALINLSCLDRAQIENNSIIVLSDGIQHNEHYENMNNIQHDPVRAGLEMVLHKNCVRNNLPKNTIPYQRKNQTIIINDNNNITNHHQNSITEYAFYSAICVSVVALLIVVILAFCLCHARKQSYNSGRQVMLVNKPEEEVHYDDTYHVRNLPPIPMMPMNRPEYEEEHIYEDPVFMSKPSIPQMQVNTPGNKEEYIYDDPDFMSKPSIPQMQGNTPENKEEYIYEDPELMLKTPSVPKPKCIAPVGAPSAHRIDHEHEYLDMR